MILDDFKNKFVKKLPDSPGVYFFRKGREILYIGKATSLRSRVRSYFAPDLLKARSMFIADMVYLATSITHQKTESALEALILEANLIKKYLPKYNTKDKDNKSFNYLIITNEDYPRLVVMRGRDLELAKAAQTIEVKYQFGPFMNGGALQEALKIIRKVFPYRDTCEPNQGRACFNSQIGLCPGVCTGAISKSEYAKHVRHIVLFFEGKKSVLEKTLKKEMKTYAEDRQFEKAAKAKRQLFAIKHIQDISLIKEEFRNESDISLGNTVTGEPKKKFRIESYDIAHTSGTDVVGVMVVTDDKLPQKADYRVFNIKGENGEGGTNNDTASLKEVVRRRLNHPEWQFPDVMLIDGGIGQYNAIKEVLDENNIHVRTDDIQNPDQVQYEKQVYLTSLVKDDKHKPRMFLGNEVIGKKYKKILLLANAEAHRFTLAQHRKRRTKRMLGKI